MGTTPTSVGIEASNQRSCKIRTTSSPSKRDKKGKAKASNTQLGEWKKWDKGIAPVKALIFMISMDNQTPKRKLVKESVSKAREEQKKLKGTSQKTPKGILSCTDAKERIVVKEKYPKQTIVIGKQLPTNFNMKLQEDMLVDIKETFDKLRANNMKLNPSKCSFGVEEGLFLGHLITKQGIKLGILLSDPQKPESYEL
nr:reverse transcriptase domain-containing protein [Tanacetum cinerariifolium]